MGSFKLYTHRLEIKCNANEYEIYIRNKKEMHGTLTKTLNMITDSDIQEMWHIQYRIIGYIFFEGSRKQFVKF